VSWLLGQIGLSLVLAALAGWFIGWYLRAFRDQDRVEDLRQTMLDTKDVKDRELNELRRQTEDLESRLARASTSAMRPVAAMAGSTSARVEVSSVAEQPALAEPTSAPAPLVEIAAAGDAERAADVDHVAVAAAERERRREADAALRRKTAAMLTFQAEIEALREAVAEKAALIAQLQERLAGTEPTGRELESTHGEVSKLQARLRVLEQERDAAGAAAADQDAGLLASRKEIVIRDTRINDLRNRCAALETQVADAREGAINAGGERHGRFERDLEDSRRALQRQIDRNRKQEAVHRAVVEQLEGDKARLRAGSVFPTEPSPADGGAGGRRGLPQKRSDELTQISGVGPAFARALREAGVDTYAQIATWRDRDIDRYAVVLGAHAKRIRTDRWVEQARELAQTSRAHRD